MGHFKLTYQQVELLLTAFKVPNLSLTIMAEIIMSQIK